MSHTIPQMSLTAQQHDDAPSLEGQRPFSDESELRRLVNRCHDRILSQSGHDPAKAFDQITTLLMLKLFDERRDGGNPQFTALPGEDAAAVGARIRELLTRCAEDDAYGKVIENTFDGRSADPRLDLDDETLAFVVQKFQDYSLSATGDLLHGADVKGVVFETMVGSTFRGNLGAYFTPRNIAEFMVQLLDPKTSDRVFDPSCGSGGFLIMVLKYIREKLDNQREAGSLVDFASKNLRGFDINERMVRIARMNLVMHGADASPIERVNGLTLHDDADLKSSFDLCFANPPFAGFESDPAILSSFEVAQAPEGTRAVNKVLPFIEEIIELLAPGGRAGIVIPISVLNAEAETFVKLRERLFRDTRLLAIVGLSEAAFHHTDCGSHGALLFFERLAGDADPSDDYEVFVDFADRVGYNRLGHKVLANDLPSILARYESQDASRMIPVSKLREAGRIDPTWWRPSNLALRSQLDQAEELISISDLYELRNETLTKRELRDGTWRFFQVKDTDLLTGEIVTIHDAIGEELPGRIRRRARAGDVLLPNHRDSLIAKTGVNGRSAAIVPPELDGVLTTNRFFVLEPKVDPELLRSLLNSPFVRQQLTMQARGGASLDITEEALANVKIPSLDRNGAEFAEMIKQAEARVTELRAALATAELQARDLVAEFVSLADGDSSSG
jgi:type I restriction-modification system DNA methylase subunit